MESDIRDFYVVKTRLLRKEEQLIQIQAENEELKRLAEKLEQEKLELIMENRSLSNMIDNLKDRIFHLEKKIKEKNEYIKILKKALSRVSAEEEEYEKIIAKMLDKKAEVLKHTVEELEDEFEKGI